MTQVLTPLESFEAALCELDQKLDRQIAASLTRTIADCHEGMGRAVLADNAELESEWGKLLKEATCLKNQQSNFSSIQRPDYSEISLDILMQRKKPISQV